MIKGSYDRVDVHKIEPTIDMADDQPIYQLILSGTEGRSVVKICGIVNGVVLAECGAEKYGKTHTAEELQPRH